MRARSRALGFAHGAGSNSSASRRGRRTALIALALLAPLALAGEDTPDHAGPPVAPGPGGPARFAEVLLDTFRAEHAMDVAAYADRFYRTPGGEGYDRTLDRVARELEDAGYGATDGFALRVIETPMITEAWTPRSASFAVHLPDCPPLPLHEFRAPGDRDRVMLPLHAPAADVRGPVVLAMNDVVEGSVLVTDSPLGRRTIGEAARKGAAAVLSSAVFEFTVDPTGGDRHLDAIQYETVSPGTRTPVGKISRRTRELLAALVERHAGLEASFRAEVELEERPLRTLVAEIVGAERPDEVVTIVSHAQEPGAGDNASGVGGLCEAAVATARAIRSGALDRPARSIAFVWGDEMRQSAIFLRDTERTPVAGISADMLGQSPERTGAVVLLERSPDPGALHTLPPDEHTAWGAGPVRENDQVPSGLHVVARCALADIARICGGWRTAENPWEGGSDHDVFLARGVPAVLFWHFTDFTYHTGLDRLEMLDAEELRRTTCAVMACALAVADPAREDLERYARSLELEREVRLASARAVGSEDAVRLWEEWCVGARAWLDELCAERDGAPSDDDSGGNR